MRSARAAGSATELRPKRRPNPPEPHPDQAAAAEQIENTVASLLGREVDVAPSREGGYRVQLVVDSLEDVLELARRLRIRAAA